MMSCFAEFIRKRLCASAITMLITSTIILSIAGCGRWKAVPIENVEPISREVFKEGSIEITVTMYAKDILYMQIMNTLDGYRLRTMPEISSDTGDVVAPSIRDDNGISFNYSPTRESCLEDQKEDIVIEWTLEERGDEGFLILRKKILIDIGGKFSNYRLNSVKIAPVLDEE